MVIINIMGGLGNQMFQYAAARHLAIKHNTDIKIDALNFHKCTSNKEHTLQLTRFSISATQATVDEIAKYRSPGSRIEHVFAGLRKALKLPAKSVQNPYLYIEPDGSGFKPAFLDLGPDIYLFGYFNSFKYFEPIRGLLVEEYKPEDELSSNTVNILRQIEDTNSISIHIRRGDYVTDPNVSNCIKGIITDTYYGNAISYILSRVEKPHFFVFSNDMTWVKRNLQIPSETTYVDINSPQKGYEDLWIMSRCKHNITAGGSTFSWWAAYLNPNTDKIVIRTENISNDPNYNHPEDYFPLEWKSVKS